jgi:amidase
MPHRERLEARTRGIDRVGAAIPEPALRWAREAQAEQAAAIGRLWDEVDVVLCPVVTDGPYRAGQAGRWNTATYLLRAGERLPYLGTYNLTGQPGCAVPAGRDDDGLPVGVQLVGRLGGDATLLSLAAQLEAERPWAQERPPVS